MSESQNNIISNNVIRERNALSSIYVIRSDNTKTSL